MFKIKSILFMAILAIASLFNQTSSFAVELKYTTVDDKIKTIVASPLETVTISPSDKIKTLLVGPLHDETSTSLVNFFIKNRFQFEQLEVIYFSDKIYNKFALFVFKKYLEMRMKIMSDNQDQRYHSATEDLSSGVFILLSVGYSDGTNTYITLREFNARYPHTNVGGFDLAPEVESKLREVYLSRGGRL